MVRLVAVLLIPLFLAGCASVQPVQLPVVGTNNSSVETVKTRLNVNYELGAEKSSYVGESMLRVKDSVEITRTFQADGMHLVATQDFTMQLPPFTSVGVLKSERIVVVGTTERDGRTYRVVRLPGAAASMLRFLIDESGAFEGSAINHMGNRMGFSYEATPANVRLVPAEGQSFSSSAVTANFELVYTGADEDSIRVMYREYTDDNMARPAFSQDLVYAKSDEIIRFRRIRLSVSEASNERIVFSVLEDGFAQDESVIRSVAK